MYIRVVSAIKATKAKLELLAPLTLGLYVDDFVSFSYNKEVEAKFRRILSWSIKVEFMGVVEGFLCTHFP